MSRSILRRSLLILLGSVALSSQIFCKKKVQSIFENNEITGTVNFSSGAALNIHVTGVNARMGCDIFGISSWLEALNDASGRLAISCFGPCVETPGTTDNVDIHYERYQHSQTSPFYANVTTRAPGNATVRSGRVTFTVVTGNYWEGNFTATCWSSMNSDSVLVTGTFKGRRN